MSWHSPVFAWATGSNILDGYLGNAGWSTTLLLAGLAIALFWRLTTVAKHQRLLGFFGIVRGRPMTTIYTSRVEVRERQPTDTEAPTVGVMPVNNGYSGPTINAHEYRAAILLQKQIATLPRAWVSRRILGWYMWHYLGLDPTEPAVEVSPAHGRTRRESKQALAKPEEYSGLVENAVLVGNGMYNLHAYRVGEQNSRFEPFVTFERDGLWSAAAHPGESHPLAVRCWKRRGKQSFGCDWLQGRGNPAGERELFVIQRLSYQPAAGPPVVVVQCAGTCAAATVAAVLCLLADWETLADRFKSQDFAVCFAARIPQAARNDWPSDSLDWGELNYANY